MKNKLILLMGKKQSGKSTMGNYLQDNYNYTQYALADKLKYMAVGFINGMLDVDETPYSIESFESTSFKENPVPFKANVQNLTGRDFLKLLGAGGGVMEKINPNYFIDFIKTKLLTRKDLGDVVITDIRLIKEMESFTDKRIQALYDIIIVEPVNYNEHTIKDEHITENLNYVADFKIKNSFDILFFERIDFLIKEFGKGIECQ